jgi:hypothetical protein
LSRRLSVGFEFEWVEALDPGVVTTTAFSPYLTLWASEFQRIRLQYSNIAQPGGHDNAGFIQWTAVLGSHVHGFRDRWRSHETSCAFRLAIVLMFLVPSEGWRDHTGRRHDPDLADMARHIGGDLLEVKSSPPVWRTSRRADETELYPLLNRADVVLLMGLEAEHAFLPALLRWRGSEDPAECPGYIDCSVYITPLEVPTRIDRALGDQHRMGNPIQPDPVRGKDMARAIADGLRATT